MWERSRHGRKYMKYAALLRGINVGGKNVVKMDDIKQLFLNLGLLKIKTYIQSGNVVFETNIVEHLYIYFLDLPKQAQVDDICKGYVGPDTLRMGKREIYLLCHQSIRKSKLAIRTAKVFDSATVRNWKTVNKLNDMLTSQ